MSAALQPFIGKAYARGGRGPEAFDCWGLVLAVRGALGLVRPPDFGAPTLTAQEQAALAEASDLARAWPEVDAGALRDGTIAYAWSMAHAGVVIGGRVVHCVDRYGVVAWSFGRWTSLYPKTRFYEWHT